VRTPPTTTGCAPPPGQAVVSEVGPDELARFGASDRLLANVNTPAEYASLEALQGHKL
jgi:hypothetical protein